jgi:ribosome assembly protein YihI (activator of Der GTPase)
MIDQLIKIATLLEQQMLFNQNKFAGLSEDNRLIRENNRLIREDNRLIREDNRLINEKLDRIERNLEFLLVVK